MIYEYALDPGVLKDWQVFKYLADGFGLSRARMIARYPKDWLRLAYEVVDKLEDNAKKRFVTWLADRAKQALTEPRAGAHPYILPSWYENAVAEHKRMPFHAIVADQPSSENPPVLGFADVDHFAVLWAIGTQVFIARSVADIAQRAAPLLAHATAIRFIDPYFTGDPDQIGILIGCLSKSVADGKTKVVSIELHVDGSRVQSSTESHLLRALGSRWPAGLPKIRIVRWRDRYLHNRFILTDRGGILFGDSLRQHDSRPDQMTLLEEATRARWWNHHDASLHGEQVFRVGEEV